MDLKEPYTISIIGKKENIYLKAVTMIDPVTIWFEAVRYYDKREISIAKLVETAWVYRYPRPIEIMYDQGKEFIGHEFRKFPIVTEYRKTAKRSTSGNPMSNAVLERIHQVLGNLVWTFNISHTYVDEDDPWTGILAAAAFAISSTTNRQKGSSPGQLVFGCGIIILI